MKFPKIILIILFSLFTTKKGLSTINIRELSGSMIYINHEIANLFNKEIVKSIANVTTESEPETTGSYGKIISFIVSPLLGATSWEMGTIWNYYKFSPSERPITMIVKHLFHEAQDSLVPSISNSTVGKYLNPKIIGYIIGILLITDKTNKVNIEETRKKVLEFIKQNYDGSIRNRNVNKFVNACIKSEAMKFLILQALAYIKMNNKEDIIKYYEGVAAGLGISDIADVFDTVLYNTGKQTNIKINKINKILAGEDGTSFSPNSLSAKDAEEFLIAKNAFNYNSEFPKIVPHKNSTKYKKDSYPDCVETTVRNLTNIISHDGLIFSTENITDKFKPFYEEASPENVGTQKTHNDWAALINGSEFIPYIYLSDGLNKINSYSIRNNNTTSFVIVPNLEVFNNGETLYDKEIYLGDKPYILKKVTVTREGTANNYIIIDKSDETLSSIYCFEVAGGAVTMVSLLHKIFSEIDLGEEFNVEQDFFKDNFTDKLIPTLQILGLKISLFSGKINNNFKLKLQKGLNKCIIVINYNGHGEIPLSSVKQSKPVYNKKFKNSFDPKQSTFKLIALTGMYDKLNQINKDNFFVSKLMSINLLELIKKFINPDEELDEKIIMQLIESLKFKNEHSFLNEIYNFITNLNQRISEELKQLLYKKITEITCEAINSNDFRIIKEGFKLFNFLSKDPCNLSSNQVYKIVETITTIVTKAINNNNIYFILNLLNLVFEGFSNFPSNQSNKIIEDYMTTAMQIYIPALATIINSNNRINRDKALNLLEILFKVLPTFSGALANKIIEITIPIAKKAMNSENRIIRDIALKLFNDLFLISYNLSSDQANKIIEMTIPIAKKAMNSENRITRDIALKLFKIFFKYFHEFLSDQVNKIIEMTIPIAIETINSNNKDIRNTALKLLNDLFLISDNLSSDQANKIIEAIKTIAIETINSNNETIRDKVLELCDILLKYHDKFSSDQANEIIGAIKAIAIKTIKNNDKNIRNKVLELCDILLKYHDDFLFDKANEIIEAVITIATIALTTIYGKSWGIQTTGLSLFIKVFEYLFFLPEEQANKIFVAIKTIATKAINSNKKKLRDFGKKLNTKLESAKKEYDEYEPDESDEYGESDEYDEYGEYYEY